MAYDKNKKSSQKQNETKIWLNFDVENAIFCKVQKHGPTENGYWADCLLRTEKDAKSDTVKFFCVTVFGGPALFFRDKGENGLLVSGRVWVQARKAETGNWYNGLSLSGLKAKGYDKDKFDDLLEAELGGQTKEDEQGGNSDDLPF